MIVDDYLFLSYRSLERQFALRLANDLKNEGLRVWMDVFEIRTSDDWVQRLQDSLNASKAVVAVLTPEYVASMYCRRELKRADSLGHPIYPVLLRRLRNKEDWPLEIQERQYIDFTEWRTPERYQDKLGALVKDLGDRFSGVVGKRPDRERRYMNSLIADLEARRGILEYVDLEADVESSLWRQPPWQDEWGFSHLEKRDQVTTKVNLDADIWSELSGKVVLLGEPGAGKSTALRRLALAAAYERLQRGQTAPLPLVRYLQEWPDELSVREFMGIDWPFESDPIGALSSGACILFLDGLNEMGSSWSTKIAQLKKWLKSEEAPANVIVTCRKDDYERLKLENEKEKKPIKEATIRSLNGAQIRHFAINYLGDKADDFMVAIANSKLGNDDDGLTDLTSNPYLLSALIYVFSSSGQLGENELELFGRMTRALWAREQQRHTLGWVPFDEALVTISSLAYQMILQNRPTTVEWQFVEDILGSELTGVCLGAGILDATEERVRFSHQALQEYFAAESVKQIGWQDLPPDSLYGNVTAWQYVLRNVVRISSNPASEIQMALDVSPYLVQQASNAFKLGSEFADFKLPIELRTRVKNLRRTHTTVSNLLWDTHHADVQYALEKAWADEERILPVLMDIATHIDHVEKSDEGERVVRFAISHMKTDKARTFYRSWQSEELMRD